MHLLALPPPNYPSGLLSRGTATLREWKGRKVGMFLWLFHASTKDAIWGETPETEQGTPRAQGCLLKRSHCTCIARSDFLFNARLEVFRCKCTPPWSRTSATCSPSSPHCRGQRLKLPLGKTHTLLLQIARTFACCLNLATR